MSGVGEALFGPLAGLECRRALGRRWVLLVRALAALPPAAVVLAVAWSWWFSRQMQLDRWPATEVRVGLLAVAGLAVTLALLVGPALLSGTLAGDRGRSMLGLLLATAVSPREIVLGRLAGGLCVVGVFGAAGVPALVLLAGLRGLDAPAAATLLGLPTAVALGSGGLTVAASAMARRGRDALLAAYCLEILLVVFPALVSAFAVGGDWLEPLNPYAGLGLLCDSGEPRPALGAMAVWTALGAVGCAIAAWRLRPTYLHEADGRPAWRWLARWGRVPPVGDRPIVWKELYFERVPAFGRLVRWLGILLAGAFVVVSLGLAGLVAWSTLWQPDPTQADWARDQLAGLAEMTWPLALLLQWAMGLRAAAAVASERQRGTWDSLLLTPLPGSEIVAGKIYGGVYALRGFAAALVVGWAAALACGAMPVDRFVLGVADILVVGLFMVVLGVRCSLATASATWAMTWTVLGWLAAYIVIVILAGILTLTTMLIVFVGWLLWVRLQMQMGTPVALGAGPPFGIWLGAFLYVVRLVLYLIAAFSIAGWCRTHFDRLAGRAIAVGPLSAKRGRRARAKAPACGDKSAPGRPAGQGNVLGPRG